jgi:hypothetical protein
MGRSSVDIEAEIDQLYGLPLDEFVAERGAAAKRVRAAGDREAADRIKALRKPTAGAWALNQAVRRRRSETNDLLVAGERLRAAHDALLSGGDRSQLRAAMARERELVGVLADCAEAIASETGKSGPVLRERVRATLHAAALDEAVREHLAAGRLVREQEAVGLGAFGAGPAEPAAPARRTPKAERAAPAGKRAAEQKRADEGKRAAERDRAAERERAAEQEHAAAVEEAERRLAEARSALADAEVAHDEAAEAADSARAAAKEAERAERDAGKLTRERRRELARQERALERLRR